MEYSDIPEPTRHKLQPKRENFKLEKLKFFAPFL